MVHVAYLPDLRPEFFPEPLTDEASDTIGKCPKIEVFRTRIGVTEINDLFAYVVHDEYLLGIGSPNTNYDEGFDKQYIKWNGGDPKFKFWPDGVVK